MALIEKIAIQEHTHPEDGSRLFLVQFAVDGVPCVPFWSNVVERKAMGDDAWIASLRERAESLVWQYGRSSTVLT